MYIFLHCIQPVVVIIYTVGCKGECDEREIKIHWQYNCAYVLGGVTTYYA